VGHSEDRSPAERGWEVLTTRTFSPAGPSLQAYENAWKQWGLEEKPSDYSQAFRSRYGLWEAPYDNAGLPMGMRRAVGVFGMGLTSDCMLCHAGRVAGQTIIGLGNASIDFQGATDDLLAADGIKLGMLPTFSNVRGTIEAAAAIGYLMQFRHSDLTVRPPVEMGFSTSLYEDIPAWWNLSKKRTMYHNGGFDSRSVRSLLTFMLSPLNSGEYIKQQESAFADIRAFMLSLEPPKYPFAIDESLAARGKEVFVETCARCHGTYGPNGKYPNKIVSLDVIGTDATLATGSGFSLEAAEHFANSWFAREVGPDGERYLRESAGYQAPPLDGVWATAPYFHNASVPTVYHVLNSRVRPKVFTRSYRTEVEDYDAARLGLIFTELDAPPREDLPPFERRKIYDTSGPGQSNRGHTFGDDLTDDERLAVIEYLKTL
jgi:hypothetical protein